MDKWDKKYVDFRPTLITHKVGISHSTACNEIAIEIRGVSEANRHGPMYGIRVYGLLGVNCVSESGVPLITVRDLLLK